MQNGDYYTPVPIHSSGIGGQDALNANQPFEYKAAVRKQRCGSGLAHGGQDAINAHHKPHPEQPHSSLPAAQEVSVVRLEAPLEGAASLP